MQNDVGPPAEIVGTVGNGLTVIVVIGEVPTQPFPSVTVTVWFPEVEITAEELV